MNRNVRGIGFYIVLAVLFVLMAFGLKETLKGKNALTYREFQQLLEKDQIASVDIAQNKEVPTGVLTIVKMDGTTEEMYVSDVRKVQEELAGYEVKVQVEDVQRDSVFLTTLLPVLLMEIGRAHV